MLTLIYYLDVLSSWCFYAEPNLRRLLDVLGERVRYEWRIALVENPAGGYSHRQYDWFYRRSGSISGVQLNSGWVSGKYDSSIVPNAAAEAARELGFSDDRVRLALSRAALVDGKPILDPAVSAEIVSHATGVASDKIRELIDDHHIRQRIADSGEEFKRLDVDQRPAFVLSSDIGDKVVFSGVWAYEPLHATATAMLGESAKYAAFAHDNPPFPDA